MTLQNFGKHHAWYMAGSAVYYAGSPNLAPNDSEIIPTLLVGYERHLSAEHARDPAGLRQSQRLLASRHRPG